MSHAARHEAGSCSMLELKSTSWWLPACEQATLCSFHRTSNVIRLGYLLIVALIAVVSSAAGAGSYWVGNGHYYEAVHVPQGVTWQEASNACISAGGYLVTITSAEENAFVFDLAKSNPKMWFRDPFGNGQGPWLGGRRRPGSSKPGVGWQWAVTGESFTYSNWAPGEPNNFRGWGENRVVFFRPGGLIGSQWNDLNENVRVRGYILERDPPPRT
jgi:hypothetical protein